jgi:hypothetical protein
MRVNFDYMDTVLRSLPEGAAGDAVFAGVDPEKLSVYTIRVTTRRV